MEQRYAVSKKWEQSYPDPIVLRKEDRVIIDFSVENTTPGWDNWLWCISADGLTGWVPAQILTVINTITDDKKEAVVSADYSAIELTVEKGEILIGTTVLNGWVWCRHQNRAVEGWVPSDNLQLIQFSSWGGPKTPDAP